MEENGVYYGIYRGFVANNEDPKFLGRLQLKVPQVYDDDVPDYWAWPKGMFAGNQTGFFAIPSVDDGVWVSFENGDPQYPVWEYGWFAENEVPNAAKNNGNKPTNTVLQTKTGHKIELDDHNELIKITNSEGLFIKIAKTGITIEARDKSIKINSNDNEISLTKSGINISSDKKISLNGGFEALYNKIVGMPITDVSQIGVSKKVTLG